MAERVVRRREAPPGRKPARRARLARNICVALGELNIYVALMNASQARRYLAKRGATFALGKGGHLIVTLNGKRSTPPQHGGVKELGEGLWLAILKQLDVKD
jgi:mRNA interferase HicA